MLEKTIHQRQPPTLSATLSCETFKDMPALLQKIYINRGITHADDINYALSELLTFHDLRHIEKATALLTSHLCAQHKILVIGDFDSDGATSTALACKALKALGALHVHYLIPNRFEYGYGLTPEIVETAQKNYQPHLIITVDNGISSHDGVKKAHAYGIEVLITDHHLPGPVLPEAEVIINPNQLQDSFKSKNLAGVGVIFYVMVALRDHLKQQALLKTPVNMAQFLDLVALGTAADAVFLDKNNRILIQQGLIRIRKNLACPGIQALLAKANRVPETLQASDLGFSIAPRLNAAGRLQDMSLGVACLLAENSLQASKLAEKLDHLNCERRTLESAMTVHAESLLETLFFSEGKEDFPAGLCLYHPDFHQGIIGILAGRLKERYHRPVIVFAKVSETELKGSARSIEGIHLRDILARIDMQHPGLLLKFGGHAMAAGLSLSIDKWQVFSELFQAVLHTQLTADMKKNILLTDGELTADEISLKTATLLRLQPWGQGFPAPLFEGKFTVRDQQLLQKKHLKLSLALPENRDPLPPLWEAIFFNHHQTLHFKYTEKLIHAVYRLDLNHYPSPAFPRLQLLIEHVTCL